MRRGKTGCRLRAGAFALAATIAGALTAIRPAPADAQVIKPPPAILGGRSAPVEPAGAPFVPIKVVYRQSEGEGFTKPTGVFVERETGEILVTDSTSNLVTLLSRDGVPIHTFGYNGEVVQPARAVLDKRGHILVLAGVPRKLKIFNYRGEGLGDFPFPGYEGAAQALPTAMTIDGRGNLYIADDTTRQILVYSADGRLTKRIGKRGTGPGAFTSVSAIAVDASGTIYVVDARHEPAIQIFDAQGIYVRGWGEHSGGPQNVSLPVGIAVGPTGRIFVADTLRQTVTVFAPEGHYLFRFGGMGRRPGDLAFPSGLDADGAGRLYVTEIGNARLQVFAPRADGPAVRPGQHVPTAARQGREAIRHGLDEVLKGMGD